MTPERDEDSGQFKVEYPVQAFLQAVRDLETPTTSEVAECVGCSYDLAYRRLAELEEEGEIGKKNVGNSLLWLPVE